MLSSFIWIRIIFKSDFTFTEVRTRFQASRGHWLIPGPLDLMQTGYFNLYLLKKKKQPVKLT